MQKKSPQALAGALVVGLIYFSVLMGLSTAFAAINANVSPDIPWFPVPALALIAIATVLVGRKWPLRLNRPVPALAARLYALALLVTFAAMCVSVLEASYHGLTRSGTSWDGDVSGAFQITFLLMIPFIASILAELAFRGIIQTQLERWLALWPMLLLIAVLNGAFHFYDPEQSSQWVRFITLNIGFGYVTWLAQSIWPAIVAHVAMNIVEPVTETWLGPIATGDLPSATLISTGILGFAALGAGIFLAHNLNREQQHA